MPCVSPIKVPFPNENQGIAVMTVCLDSCDTLPRVSQQGPARPAGSFTTISLIDWHDNQRHCDAWGTERNVSLYLEGIAIARTDLVALLGLSVEFLLNKKKMEVTALVFSAIPLSPLSLRPWQATSDVHHSSS